MSRGSGWMCLPEGLERDLSGFAAAFIRDPLVGGALNAAFNRASATANMARTIADRAQELYKKIAAELEEMQ